LDFNNTKGNDFGSEGADALVEVLEFKSSLVHLDIYGLVTKNKSIGTVLTLLTGARVNKEYFKRVYERLGRLDGEGKSTQIAIFQNV